MNPQAEHQAAIDRLITAFRTARQTEFRHFCEQGATKGLTTGELVALQRGFKDETEGILAAVFSQEELHGPA